MVHFKHVVLPIPFFPNSVWNSFYNLSFVKPGLPSPTSDARRNAFYDISGAAEKRKGKGDFDKVLAQLMVKWNLSVACVTDFLHILQRKQCQIDFETLPRDSKSLTKVIISSPFKTLPDLDCFSLNFSLQI